MSKSIIKCPNCGCEYLPAEIYYPDQFLGQPVNVIKDGDGIILGHNGTDPNYKEKYICDKCNHQFEVSASVNFKANIVEDLFEQDENFFS